MAALPRTGKSAIIHLWHHRFTGNIVGPQATFMSGLCSTRYRPLQI
jgi:hypothetical protein